MEDLGRYESPSGRWPRDLGWMRLLFAIGITATASVSFKSERRAGYYLESIVIRLEDLLEVD